MSLEESQTTIETIRTTSFKPLEIEEIQKGKAILPKDFDLENTYNFFFFIYSGVYVANH